jgi:hypothetical protein
MKKMLREVIFVNSTAREALILVLESAGIDSQLAAVFR